MAASEYRVRPSNLYRIRHCEAALQMGELYPQEEGEEAREGTAAHECAAVMFEGLTYKTSDITSNGVSVDQDMLNAAKMFYGEVMAWDRGHMITPIIEKQIPCKRLHPLCGGTPDAFGYNIITNTIFIGDFKYGHRYVEVYENEQLTAYTEGAIDQFGINGTKLDDLMLEWLIVQPRAYGRQGAIKRYRFKYSDLNAVLNELRNKIRGALGPNPIAQPGSHCRDCPGRHACMVLRQTGGAIIELSRTMERFDLTPTQTGEELARLQTAQEIITGRISGLEEQAIAALHAGERVLGYTLEQSYGREIWKADQINNIVGMGEMMGINLLKPREPITPTQARALGFDTGPTGYELTYKPRGAMKLVPIDLNETSKIFGAK